jgi:DNA-binding MarR family transcriptional regulator
VAGVPRELSDHVDRVRAQWARERPELDTQPIAVIARLGRAAHSTDLALAQFFGRHGLSRADWDVLASLRREGPPYSLSPTALSRALMRTTGAMSQRLASLERKDLVARALRPADRRGVVVKLTTKGRELVDEIAADHLANERNLLAGLSAKEQELLASLLKKLLLSYESTDASPRQPPVTSYRSEACLAQRP